MIVNQKVLDELYKDAGYDKKIDGEECAKQGKVCITKVIYEDENNLEIKANVKDEGLGHNVYIKIENSEIDDVSCTCSDYKENYGSCKHIVATMIEFVQNSDYIKLFTVKDVKIDKQNEEPKKDVPFYSNSSIGKNRIFKQLVNELYSPENTIQNEINLNKVLENEVGFELKIIKAVYNNNLKMELKIGTSKQMYKLKDLVEFYDNMKNHKNYKYGAKLEFVHTKEAFKIEDRPLLEFIMKYSELIKYANEAAISSGYYGRALNTNSIILSDTAIDDLFEILKGRYVSFSLQLADVNILFKDEEPEIEFIVEENNNEYTITTNIDIFEYDIIKGQKYIYFLYENKLYKCGKNFQNTVLKILKIFRNNYASQISFGRKELPNFFSVVMPIVKNNVNMEKINKSKIEKYIPNELEVKVFLDYDELNNIVADIRFVYGNEEFNPLVEDRKDIARNIIKEDEATNIFARTGFMFDDVNNRLILTDEEKIYNFLVMGIENYMQKFEVLATENFKQKEIKQPKISSIGVRVENNLLSIDMSKMNFSKDEITEIMKKYKMKRKYHRLKNGSFMDLENNSSLQLLENIATGMDIEYEELEKETINLPMYRALYMDKLLQTNKNTMITKNDEYSNLINSVEERNIEENISLPKSLTVDLRDYQVIGFQWLEVLEKYGFGGILADDMGLGKTIQLIAVIASYIEETNNPKPSIVVCPSSLSLNWYNEIQKFAPNIKTLVISGSMDERKRQMETINEYDLIVSSYDLLKRDIDIYEEKKYEFKYIIADEAQYIKNNNTQNSKAIKKIKAETRYALTGTPIENSLSELWSIFDFIMPGYLFGYKKFKEKYEMPIIKSNDEKSMTRLKMQIEPFILRRIKEDVLTELPEKTITILNNSMNDEQEKIYISYMEQARKEAKEELAINGFEKNQIKILALLTRLRQICCHPSLFLDNYEGESSKLNQCIEILKEAISGGHKVLLFSGYTSMFKIIEKELKKEQINYYKLTGSTKVSERIELVDNFNKNSDVKVFLISLKAGGTGLNLIGADMVIHYDPWWNLSAENQATDRTYRIGQKRNVQVYKMITKNSIEEKIYEMQQRKARLMDSMLSTETTFINKLSKEDIMELFDI